MQEDVRAPIPIMRDTLYGEGQQQMLRHHSRARHVHFALF